jgi:excisionase family DNA binding protein
MKEVKESNDTQPIQSIKEMFLTREGVAEQLQCSMSYVDNLRRNGFLKSYSIGRLVRFKREDIIEAITNSQNSRI